MIKIIKSLVLLSIPALVMISLIPFVANDYQLTAIYILFIAITLIFKREPRDLPALFFGLIIITFFEFIFVKTGVETFSRKSLFGAMPLWLPVLWAYGFILIKRGLNILNKK